MKSEGIARGVDEADAGISVGGVDHLVKPPIGHDRVVVEEADERIRRSPKPLVCGLDKAQVLRIPDDPHAPGVLSRIRLKQLAGWRLAPVVNQDHLMGPRRGRRQTVEASLGQRRLVPDRDDDIARDALVLKGHQ